MLLWLHQVYFIALPLPIKKEAERFVEVLDKAAQQPKWKPQHEVAPLVRDPEKIRAIAFGVVAAHKAKQSEIADDEKISLKNKLFP